MSILYTDQIVIVNYTTDDWGVKTKHESAPINARVEDFNNLITDDRGQEVLADMIIFCKTALNVNYGDYVKILIKGGEEFNQPDKEWLIKKRPDIHGFSKHHKEIYI